MDINEIKIEESKHLDYVIKCINNAINVLNDDVKDKKQEFQDHKEYLWMNIYEMDNAEKAANADIWMNQENNINRDIKEYKSLLRLVKSPYFGKIVFSYDEDDEYNEEFYIGIRGFDDEDIDEPLIYDWRAPISSMFYECEEGKASYLANEKIFYGTVKKKRQFKISNGKIEFVLDSSIKINDEILQEALSHSTNNKMKNIVSTIQKEQNQIIRNNKSDILVVQGVAGSGKTSIALHRIAYILYANRDKIKSTDILIVSPNKVFSNYISNVLPELGESCFNEMSIDDLVYYELKDICNVENRFDYVEFIINHDNYDSERIKSIEYKSSIEFYEKMIAFLEKFMDRYIHKFDVNCDKFIIPKDFLIKAFNNPFIKKQPFISQIDEVVELFFDKNICGHIDGMPTKKQIVKRVKDKCLLSDSVIDVYNDFLSELGHDIVNKKNINYEDAFPIVLFKFSMYGHMNFNRIKHVVIDEMQDYSSVQFAVLKKLFPCQMTILGDVNQVLKKNRINVLDSLEYIFKNAEIVRMNKTYRSTAEITSLANNLVGIDYIEMFNRHGDIPIIIRSDTKTETFSKIIDNVVKLKADGFNNIAIICRDARNTYEFYSMCKEAAINDIKMFSKNSKDFDGGVIVIPSYLAKGLEFDAVIIPDADEINYNNDIDRQIMYISFTRALHKLIICSSGNVASFLKEQ